VIIEEWILGEGIKIIENEACKILEETEKEFIVFTDAGIKNNKRVTGWVWKKKKDNTIISKQGIELEDEWSINELELIAVILIIIMAKDNSQIEIFVDNQSVVNNWSKIINNKGIWDTKRLWNKDNTVLWKGINETIIIKEIEIEIKWVKGHDKCEGNLQADKICKEMIKEENTSGKKIKLNIPNNYTWKWNIWWHGFKVFINPRKFAKQINKARHRAEWITAEKNSCLLENIEKTDIEWEMSFKNISKNIKNKDLENNNVITAYRIKNWIEKQPTLVEMNIREPEIYKSGRCIRCRSAAETWLHIWICKANKPTLGQIIYTNLLICKEELNKDETITNDSIWVDITLIRLNEKSLIVKGGRKFHELLKGILNKEVYGEIFNNRSKEIINNMINRIIEDSREKIWKPRCSKVERWKKESGIKDKINKKKWNERRKKNKRSDKNKRNRKLTHEGRESIGFKKATDKRKKEIKMNITNRWIGKGIEEKKDIKNIWYKNKVADLDNRFSNTTLRLGRKYEEFSILENLLDS
jgi:ribonuclease HI